MRRVLEQRGSAGHALLVLITHNVMLTSGSSPDLWTGKTKNQTYLPAVVPSSSQAVTRNQVTATLVPIVNTIAIIVLFPVVRHFASSAEGKVIGVRNAWDQREGKQCGLLDWEDHFNVLKLNLYLSLRWCSLQIEWEEQERAKVI